MYTFKTELARMREGYPLDAEVSSLAHIFDLTSLSGAASVADRKGALVFAPTNAPTLDGTLVAVNFGSATQDTTGKLTTSGAFGALGTKDFALVLSGRLNNAGAAGMVFTVGDSVNGPFASVQGGATNCTAIVGDLVTTVTVTQATALVNGRDYVLAFICDRDGNLVFRVHDLTTDTVIANSVTGAMTPTIPAASDMTLFNMMRFQKMYGYAAGLFIFNAALTAAQRDTALSWLMHMGAVAQQVVNGARAVRAHSGFAKLT